MFEINDTDDHERHHRFLLVHRDNNKNHFEYLFEQSVDENDDDDDELEEDNRNTTNRNDTLANNNEHQAKFLDNQRMNNKNEPMIEPVDTVVNTEQNDRDRDETYSNIDAFLSSSSIFHIELQQMKLIRHPVVIRSKRLHSKQKLREKRKLFL